MLVFALGSALASENLIVSDYTPDQSSNRQNENTKNFGSEFLYSIRLEAKGEESKKKYTPGIRLTYSTHLRNRWFIDTQISYRTFSWEMKKSRDFTLNPLDQFSGINVSIFAGNNEISSAATQEIPVTSVATRNNKLDLYDFGLFGSYLISYKGLTFKPAIGLDTSFVQSTTRFKHREPIIGSITISKTFQAEIEWLTSKSHSKNYTLNISPAIGAFLEQKIYKVVSLSGFGTINSFLETKGNIGLQLTLPIKSKSILSIGGGLDAQKRWAAIQGYSRGHQMIIYGFSALIGLDY